MKKTVRKILAVALITATTIPNVMLANTTGDKDISIDRVIDPIYPIKLGAIGIAEGSTTIIISVDNTGKMMDWVPVSATKPEFVKSVANVINLWNFKPAYKNGEPVASAISVSVKFRNDSVVMSMNGIQMVQALMNSYTDPREYSLVARYSELDRIPEPVNIVQPGIDPAIPENERDGEVVIGFFIDADGKVRMPIMMECKGDMRLANSAYDALAQWKFAPPVSHGRPTMVRASQKFIFKGSTHK
jgi:hypothetical protein